MMKHVYFLPWRGEFGQMLMHHVRWVRRQCIENYRDDQQAVTVVCARDGDDALFPEADAIWTEWEEPPDIEKKTSILRSSGNMEYLRRLEERIESQHSEDVVCIYPEKGLPHQPKWNFKPQPLHYTKFPDIDVVVCPRYREHGTHRNYKHWQEVVRLLRQAGLVVSLAGMKETSVDCRSVSNTLKSWNHDRLDSVLHMMNSAKLVLASDSGLAHLAVLNKSPLAVIYDQPGREADHPNWPWAFDHMKAHADAYCEPILHGWDDPHRVVEFVLDHLLEYQP